MKLMKIFQSISKLTLYSFLGLHLHLVLAQDGSQYMLKSTSVQAFSNDYDMKNNYFIAGKSSKSLETFAQMSDRLREKKDKIKTE